MCDLYDNKYRDAIEYLVDNGYAVRALKDLSYAIQEEHRELQEEVRTWRATRKVINKIIDGEHSNKAKLEGIQALVENERIEE